MKWISGTVLYVDLGPGFYGIVASNGKEYRPVNFPEQLKMPGKKVELYIEPANEAASIFMWGEAVNVKGFKTRD